MKEAEQRALEAFIASQAGASRVAIAEAAPLSGGAIQENWLVRAEVEGGPYAGRLDVVARADAPSGVAASHNRAHEFALLRAAWSAGVTVPEPLWLCEDRGVLGKPFFIMRRIDGSAAAQLLVKAARSDAERAALAERLGAELARIHSIRPPRADLDFLPWYEEPPAIRLIGHYRDFLDGHATPHPALEWGLRWLERRAPARGEVVLCHRDFRTGNYMVNEGRLTGILDWEFAGWSDPLEDIGWLCARCWRFGADGREAGGIGAREDFYGGYESASGRCIERDRVPYWEVMAHVTWAIVAIQQVRRHLSREQSSLMLALTGHIVPELEYEILRMTERL